METFNVVIGLATALVGLLASLLTIWSVRRAHAPAGASVPAPRPAQPAPVEPAPVEPAPVEAAPPVEPVPVEPVPVESTVSDVDLGLIDRIAADEARATTWVVVGFLVTAAVIFIAPGLESGGAGIALTLLVIVVAIVVGRLVYRWQHTLNRLTREVELRAGRYGGVAPASARLGAELDAGASSTMFSLAVAVVPALLLGWALGGLVALLGDIGLPGLILLLIAPYPAITGLVWPWRKRRVLLATLLS